MKTIKLTLVAVMLSIFMWSCGSNGGGSNNTQNDVPMQYTVCTSEDLLFPTKSIKVFECTENGDKIYENEFILGLGDSKTFTAQPNVKKVKVYLTLQNPLDWRNDHYGWMPLVYYLSPNESKVIKIDNNIELHRQEP